MIGKPKFGETIADRLDNLERAAGVTDDIVTKGANLRARDIEILRQSSNHVDTDVIKELAKYFGVTVGYLLHGERLYYDANIAEAKPDVISLNEFEAECIARLLQSLYTDPGSDGGSNLYSCSFCKYFNDCFNDAHGNKQHGLRGHLRDIFSKATGIKSGILDSGMFGRCIK